MFLRGLTSVPVLVTLSIVTTAEPASAGWLKRKTTALVTDALQPSINTVFGKAGTLAKDIDERLATRLEQAEGIGKGLVSDVDTTLEARILQIKSSGDELIDNALGQVDEISRQRIDQAADRASGLIVEIDGVAKRRLDQVDGILRRRIGQVDGVVKSAIRQADSVLESRIDQIDQAVGQRLGNADAIATKQRLGLERTLVRVLVAAVGCLFVALVLWRLWRNYRRLRRESGPSHGAGDRRLWVREFALPGLGNIALAIGAAIGLYVLFDALPMGAEQQFAGLVKKNRRAFDTSLGGFDFARAEYYASQLEILEPDKATEHRVRAAKASLFRAAFGRPTALASPEGRSAVESQLENIEQLLNGSADPDVMTVRAFLLWRGAERRTGEYEAASLCAGALRHGGDFVMAPLARNYVRAFLHAPYVEKGTPISRTAESLDALRLLAGAPEEADRAFPLAHVVAFDGLVRTLQRDGTRAYLEMLEAHSRYVAESQASRAGRGRRARPGPESKAAREARTKRRERAGDVLAAWQDFSRGLENAKGLEDSPAILSVFSLNDVMLSRALWFIEDKNTLQTAPPLSQVEEIGKKARLAPPRIGWSRRYGNVLGHYAKALMSFEEAERFRSFEELTIAFDNAYLAALASGTPEGSEEWREAAIAAARLGIYVELEGGRRVPLAWQRVPQVRTWLPLAQIKAGEERSLSEKEWATLREALVERTFVFL